MSEIMTDIQHNIVVLVHEMLVFLYCLRPRASVFSLSFSFSLSVFPLSLVHTHVLYASFLS